jgi:hypothetical protein
VAKDDLLPFEDALENSKNRNLLLGNGFSMAQAGNQFSYSALLEKSGLGDDSSVRKVFRILDTFDFEKVMEALEAAAQIERAYEDEDRSKLFLTDAASIREALITAVHAVHPGAQFDIPQRQRDACAKFLSDFQAIFTLNYDLLLYWVILRSATDAFKDGFGLGEEVNGFRTFRQDAHCNTYYLHGALHLFLGKERETQKRILTTNTIISDIASTIRARKQLPLFVAEGKSIQKIARINSVPYLRHCYLKLLEMSGSLFVFGHAASDNDTHIYDAICASKVESIFVFVHNPATQLATIREKLARYAERRKDIKWHFLDAAGAKPWG